MAQGMRRLHKDTDRRYKKPAASRRSGRTSADTGKRRHYREKESVMPDIMTAVSIPPCSHDPYAAASIHAYRSTESCVCLTRKHYAKYINHKTAFVKTRSSESPFLRTETDPWHKKRENTDMAKSFANQPVTATWHSGTTIAWLQKGPFDTAIKAFLHAGTGFCRVRKSPF